MKRVIWCVEEAVSHAYRDRCLEIIAEIRDSISNISDQCDDLVEISEHRLSIGEEDVSNIVSSLEQLISYAGVSIIDKLNTYKNILSK